MCLCDVSNFKFNVIFIENEGIPVQYNHFYVHIFWGFGKYQQNIGKGWIVVLQKSVIKFLFTFFLANIYILFYPLKVSPFRMPEAALSYFNAFPFSYFFTVTTFFVLFHIYYIYVNIMKCRYSDWGKRILDLK